MPGYDPTRELFRQAMDIVQEEIVDRKAAEATAAAADERLVMQAFDDERSDLIQDIILQANRRRTAARNIGQTFAELDQL